MAYIVYMPRKNVIKQYIENGYYHIFNRGVNKEPIFLDDEDYVVFLNLLKRLFGNEIKTDKYGRKYPNYYQETELLSYCLLPNHFHMLVYQHESLTVAKLMQSLAIAYSMYFNKKYQRVGPVFQSQYKASLVTDDTYLHHISRYIHLNPKNYREWKYSSLPYYLDGWNASWIQPGRILDLFSDSNEYSNFLKEYFDHKTSLELSAGSYPATG